MIEAVAYIILAIIVCFFIAAAVVGLLAGIAVLAGIIGSFFQIFSRKP